MSKTRAIFHAFWRLAYAYLLYPVMIGAFLYVYIKDWHWIFGLLIIIAILILDPTWRFLARRFWQAYTKKRR